jgi:hypothetical protein
MRHRSLLLFLVGCGFATLSAAPRQSAPDDERRAAITVLRAINTAENAAKQSAGKYLALSDLLDHPAMSRVKPSFAVEANTFTYEGAVVRLALSADATQYVVTVVSAAPAYTAAFSDERGVIYTGKALE